MGPPASTKIEVVNEDPVGSNPAVLRAQATPQHAIKTQPSLTQPQSEVAADGEGTAFGGIAKASTADLDPEKLLPPHGIVLAVPPVPQILPSEIDRETEYNRREDAELTRLYKMDSVQLEREAATAKAHPLFQQWMIEEIQPEHDDTQFLLDFFNTNDNENICENICSFTMWLKTQEAEQAAALLQVSQQRPALPPTEPIPAAKASSPITAANSTQLDTPSPLLPDNQLGDPALFPPAPKSLLASSPPKPAPATPDPSAIKFQPITSEGMKAFWAVMRRKSTDSLIGSPAPPPPGIEKPPSQVATSPAVSPVSAPPAPATSAKANPSPVDAANATAKAAAAAASTPAETTPAETPAATTPAATSPSTEGGSSDAAAPNAGTNEPSADDVKEARATYMRFYRSLRSAKAPTAVTKTLTDMLGLF